MEKQIQWFPGHMAKALRIIKEKINLVDCVIEVIDARAPKSSINTNLRETIGNKPLLLVMNKSDLADKKENEKWINELKKTETIVSLDSLNGTKNIEIITKNLEVLLKNKIDKAKELGNSIYPIRAMVVGIPNVGKSTLLNNLAKRKALQTGDRPGVTKNLQYLKANDKLLLLDNPGTLWPKFESQEQGKLLALIGSIKDDIVPLEVVVNFAIDLLKKYYPNEFKTRYKLDSLSDNNEEIILEIGKKRGCLERGGIINKDKVYDLFLRDLRSGKIGALTFERVD